MVTLSKFANFAFSIKSCLYNLETPGHLDMHVWQLLPRIAQEDQLHGFVLHSSGLSLRYSNLQKVRLKLWPKFCFCIFDILSPHPVMKSERVSSDLKCPVPRCAKTCEQIL